MSKENQCNDKVNSPAAMAIDGSSVDVRKAAMISGHKDGKAKSDDKGGKG